MTFTRITSDTSTPDSPTAHGPRAGRGSRRYRQPAAALTLCAVVAPLAVGAHAVAPTAVAAATASPGSAESGDGSVRPTATGAGGGELRAGGALTAAGRGNPKSVGYLTTPPSKWDPCTTIRYRVNLSGAPKGAAADVDTAIANAFDRYDVFETEQFGLLVDVGVGVHAEDHLRHALAVTQVNEDHAAQIAAAVDPAHQQDALAGVGQAQRSAVMCAAEFA